MGGRERGDGEIEGRAEEGWGGEAHAVGVGVEGQTGDRVAVAIWLCFIL